MHGETMGFACLCPLYVGSQGLAAIRAYSLGNGSVGYLRVKNKQADYPSQTLSLSSSRRRNGNDKADAG